MKNPVNIPTHLKFRASYLFFIIFNILIGVGIVAYPSRVFQYAKQDSWLVLILVAIIVHLILAIIIFILRTYQDTDLYGILQETFGNWFAKLICYLFIIYFFTVYLSALAKYTEFIVVFIFPQLSKFIIGFFITILIAYSIYGGIRVIVGVSFIFFFLTFFVFALLVVPASMIDINNYFPLFEVSRKEVFEGMLLSTYSFIGIEVLWYLYPYIRNKEKTMLYSQLGLFAATILLLINVIISIGFFAPKQLESLIWPVLGMYKIISFSIFERLDIFAVSYWIFIILPNLILYAWLITRSLKRIHQIKQKHSIWAIIILSAIGLYFIQSSIKLEALLDVADISSIFFVFLFPILLFPFAIIKRIRGTKK
ncbi:GerAB/ArcD/ProY family transporter [Allobacillus sp. GCM10007491]|uniref:GerAB/ArcD/ProY family transporter n=1 Tax=Allobacillus saliphilus TaxID=2912308 RepID=A0A941CUN7_9BACI|nr:GerAB/ArcD/ProY family transporter [Allobacillus saliphilus]MBR7553040.1 GerAB/ArcD/ProY family transporter [Allobacillus saliphilus]